MEESVKPCQAITIIVQHSLFYTLLSILSYSERCCFYGVLIADSPYLNKDENDYPFGSGGAIRYV